MFSIDASAVVTGRAGVAGMASTLCRDSSRGSTSTDDAIGIEAAPESGKTTTAGTTSDPCSPIPPDAVSCGKPECSSEHLSGNSGGGISKALGARLGTALEGFAPDISACDKGSRVSHINIVHCASEHGDIASEHTHL